MDSAQSYRKPGSSSKSMASKSSGKKKKKRVAAAAVEVPEKDLTLEEQLARAKEKVQQEKAGKRKLFHSLVKLANELRRTRDESIPLEAQRKYADRNWYEGGIWRAPQVLPGVYLSTFKTSQLREPTSLTDLFFALTIVTAFTRVGVAISRLGFVDINSLLYFGVFWTVWGKETSYSTRFDTTDLSAQAVTLVTCFAVLFASLSVQSSVNSEEGNRIMIMAAFVAALHSLLHIRVVLTAQDGNDVEAQGDEKRKEEAENINEILRSNVVAYGTFNAVVCLLEMIVWLVGALVFSEDWPYRWLFFLAGIVFALRVPRALLASDFHASCSKRGVLFILLLGFLLQSIIVVASEFFTYQTPTLQDYGFIGAACMMLFCMKLLYVDDADILAEDHALMVNKVAAFLFNVGHFTLLLSTTVLGSGLNLLTHDYMAATQALPGPAKSMVCGGFSAVLFSTFFIKSLHLKRVPIDGKGQCLFITAYLLQALTLLGVVGVSAAMCFGNIKGYLASLLESDILLLVSLSVAALVVLVMHWLDEGVELTLYGSAEASGAYRVRPFGFWWCLAPNNLPLRQGAFGEDPSVSALDLGLGASVDYSIGESTISPSITSPLLGGGNSVKDYSAV